MNRNSINIKSLSTDASLQEIEEEEEADAVPMWGGNSGDAHGGAASVTRAPDSGSVGSPSSVDDEDVLIDASVKYNDIWWHHDDGEWFKLDGLAKARWYRIEQGAGVLAWYRQPSSEKLLGSLPLADITDVANLGCVVVVTAGRQKLKLTAKSQEVASVWFALLNNVMGRGASALEFLSDSGSEGDDADGEDWVVVEFSADDERGCSDMGEVGEAGKVVRRRRRRRVQTTVPVGGNGDGPDDGNVSGVDRLKGAHGTAHTPGSAGGANSAVPLAFGDRNIVSASEDGGPVWNGTTAQAVAVPRRPNAYGNQRAYGNAVFAPSEYAAAPLRHQSASDTDGSASACYYPPEPSDRHSIASSAHVELSPASDEDEGDEMRSDTGKSRGE
jgi:hypothetical protein